MANIWITGLFVEYLFRCVQFYSVQNAFTCTVVIVAVSAVQVDWGHY